MPLSPAGAEVLIEVTDPGHPDARYCLRSYFEELAGRFEGGFDPARSISATDAEMTMPDGLLLVARWPDGPVGCGALKFRRPAQIAEIKRMWTAPRARGRGLGRALLERLVGEAAGQGMRTVRLETNRTLTEARRLYETAGFTEVSPFNNEPYAHHWFERALDRPPAP